MQEFVVADHFRKCLPGPRDVKIMHFWEGFENRLLDKIEVQVPKVTVQAYHLPHGATDGDIVAEVGQQCEVSLAHIWALLKKQPSGQPGILATENTFTVFYVRDIADQIMSVGLFHPGDGGWRIKANRLADGTHWPNTARIITR